MAVLSEDSWATVNSLENNIYFLKCTRYFGSLTEMLLFAKLLVNVRSTMVFDLLSKNTQIHGSLCTKTQASTRWYLLTKNNPILWYPGCDILPLKCVNRSLM